MEENVAIEPSKQKQFVKSLKGIKKLIKKNKEKEVSGSIVSDVSKTDKPKKKGRKNRGLVYLSHIPHGFYENEMTQYFKQFGVVTNARVIRSKRTGNSKGFAFVEFKDTDVAQIVSETMNNYLMGKRLIKAVYIPPEKQRRNALRKKWSSVSNPRSAMRLKNKKQYNENKDEAGDLKKARKLLATLAKTKKKLSELDIDYDFIPVDIPEALLASFNVKKEEKDNVVVKEETKSKKNKKVKVETEVKVQIPAVKTKKESQDAPKKGKNAVKDKKVAVKETKTVKKENIKDVVNKKEQHQKNQKLKEAGVKPAENFIKLPQESDDESDSEYEFDSDEYDKMLEQDEDDSDLPSGESDDGGSGDDSGGGAESGDDSDVGAESGDEETDDAQNDDSDEEESIIDILPLKKKGKPLPKEVAVPTKKNAKKQPLPTVATVPQAKRQAAKPVIQKLPGPDKRKAPERAAAVPVTTKKLKFEKQNTQKTIKKQFKKKK